MTEHVHETKKLSERMKGFVPVHTASITEESWKNVHVYWIDEVADLENKYETLKKATEALSAEDARFGARCIDILNDQLGETDDSIKAEKLLRAYADILEGK